MRGRIVHDISLFTPQRISRYRYKWNLPTFIDTICFKMISHLNLCVPYVCEHDRQRSYILHLVRHVWMFYGVCVCMCVCVCVCVCVFVCVCVHTSSGIIMSLKWSRSFGSGNSNWHVFGKLSSAKSERERERRDRREEEKTVQLQVRPKSKGRMRLICLLTPAFLDTEERCCRPLCSLLGRSFLALLLERE